jgi:hypothetical protein
MSGKRPTLPPPDEYMALAEQAAKLLTPGIIKRWRRIRDAGAGSRALDVQLYFENLCAEFGSAAAVDLFEHGLEIHWLNNPPRKPRGKPKGQHDSVRDRLLLKIFDENDPESALSQARVGKLKLNSEPPRRYTMHELAAVLSKHKYWGATSAEQILRRLKHLRRKRRTK